MRHIDGRMAGLLTLLLLFPMPLLAAGNGESTMLNELFGSVNAFLAKILFFDVLFFIDDAQFPFIVAWLIAAGVYLTLRMSFINLRMFRHAWHIIRGRYTKPGDLGEVTPFQALTTALSATVGLGNIAGVAIAVGVGGPGATFWMIVAGLIGMTTKFTEATLAQTYREVRPDGHIMGGAMEYLSRGLADLGLGHLGRVLAILFCIMTIGASLGGGNAFQVSQSLSAVKQSFPVFMDQPWIYGLIMATLVAIVIIGGIRRIAHVAEAIVPTMVIVYLGACLFILLANAERIPEVFGLIFSEAFSFKAGLGGFLGVIIMGFKRAAFSSEAGIGSAAIAHATAKTPYPVRQGIVALMEPFIDTVVICTMTALVIIITGVYNAPEHAQLVAQNQGAALTSRAFGSVISWFPYILTFSVVLFSFSTMISWSYYGERCWSWLFGECASLVYRLIFVAFVFIGSVTSATNILDFSDLLLLGMSFPNLIGLYLLSGKVRRMLSEYLARLRSGELDREVREAA